MGQNVGYKMTGYTQRGARMMRYGGDDEGK